MTRCVGIVYHLQSLFTRCQGNRLATQNHRKFDQELIISFQLYYTVYTLDLTTCTYTCTKSQCSHIDTTHCCHINTTQSSYIHLHGYSVSLGSRCLMCFSHFSVRRSYNFPAILWEHMFSTAWYSSSRLYEIQLQPWMADTASSNLTSVCSSKPFGKLGFTVKYST